MLKSLSHSLIILAAVSVLTGCGSLRQYNPVSYAETPEQRAYAVYGSFTVAEEQGAVLIQDASVSDSIKLSIQRADAKAKPIADKTLAAADAVALARRDLALGTSTEEKLKIFSDNLANWYTTFVPLVNDLINIVEKK